MKQIKPLIKTITVEEAAQTGGIHLVIAAFGYETRASELLRQIRAKDIKMKFAVADFTDLQEGLGRTNNNTFLLENKIPALQLASVTYNHFEKYVDESIFNLRSTGDRPISFHLDYSCMPRIWYCRLAAHLLNILHANEFLYFWYTPGIYNEKAFDPSGIEDFDVFAGQSSLSPTIRTHVLGLGFEAVRAEAILNVIDPEYLICYYANPGVTIEYANRAVMENQNILKSAQQELRLPLADFAGAFTRLRSVVQDFRSIGDVILIPDGPKPLVLAASLVPLTLYQPGVTCLHVRRKARKAEGAFDVMPSASPYGAQLRV